MNNKSRMFNLIKQTGLSAVYKVIAIGCSFLLVPMTLGYLGKEQYGLWMTMLTVLSWISLCDLGLGNGMRNAVTSALAENNIEKVRQYISTAYFLLLGIVGILIFLILLFSDFVSWQKFFNIQSLSNSYLKHIAVFLCISSLLNFLIALINQVANAYQKSSLTVVNQLIANVMSLLTTYVVIKISNNEFFFIVCAYSLSLILSNVAISFYFYRKNKNIIPSINYFRWENVKKISNDGIKFFLIQVSGLILLVKDNIIITQFLGPEYVTDYNLVYKLFSIFILSMSLLMNPLWSAYGDAFARNDFSWIKTTIKKMNILILVIGLGITMMAFLAPMILHLWVGDIQIDNSLIYLMGIYTFIFVWSTGYSAFINASGKLRFSLYLMFLVVIINIPISIYMAKLYGLNGVVIATILCMLPGAACAPIQYYFIVNEDNAKKLPGIYKIFLK